MPVVSAAPRQSRISRTARSKSSSIAPSRLRTAVDSVSITSRANCRIDVESIESNRWILATPPLKSTAVTQATAHLFNSRARTKDGCNVEYRVELDVYNGPLDLLLYLIKKDEL